MDEKNDEAKREKFRKEYREGFIKGIYAQEDGGRPSPTSYPIQGAEFLMGYEVGRLLKHKPPKPEAPPKKEE